MTFISLFSDEHGFVATNQRVFSPEELSSVDRVVDQANRLEQQLVEHDSVVNAATAKAAENGYRDAYAKAEADAGEKLAQKLRQLHEAHVEELKAVRNDCANLAVEIVRRVAGNTDPLAWIQAQAELAASELVDEPTLKLRVNSCHTDALKQRLTASESSSILTVVADDTLSPDACELETTSGRIDIGLDTQLSSILNAFNKTDVSSDIAKVSRK